MLPKRKRRCERYALTQVAKYVGVDISLLLHGFNSYEIYEFEHGWMCVIRCSILFNRIFMVQVYNGGNIVITESNKPIRALIRDNDWNNIEYKDWYNTRCF